MKGEPEKQDDDLWERLQTTKKRVEIAQLLINQKRDDLLPTMLEVLYYGTHLILEEYCVKEV